jgi:hypothetical protein
MKNIPRRTEGDYLNANWQDLYKESEQWKSEMRFYTDEFRFLNHIMDSYLLELAKNESVQKIQQLISTADKLKVKELAIAERIDKHLHNIAQLMEKVSDKDELWFRKEHNKLEQDISEFELSFASIKKDVFAITEHLLTNKKSKHMLSGSK